MKFRFLGFFGIGIQSMTLVVILVGLTVLILPSLLEDQATDVVVEHEQLDLAEETRQRGWEILDRIDTLRHDVGALAWRLREAETVPASLLPPGVADRYVRIEVWPFEEIDGRAAMAGTPELSLGQAVADPLNPGFREFREQLLAGREGEIQISRVLQFPYSLAEEDPDWGLQQAHFVIWAGQHLGPARDRSRPGRLVMAAMSLDPSFFRIAGSPRHLGLVLDDRGTLLVHPLGNTAPAPLDALLAAGVEDSDLRSRGVLQLFHKHLPQGDDDPRWGRPETLRLTTGETVSAVPLRAGVRFYFCESEKFAGLEEPARRLAAATVRKMNAGYVSQGFDKERVRLKRVWGFDHVRMTVRLLADDVETLRGLKKEIEGQLRKTFGSSAARDLELGVLPPIRWRETIECANCDLSFVRIRLDAAENSPALIIGRAQFREELDWDLSGEMATVHDLAWWWAVVAALIALVASLVITRPLQRMTSAALTLADAELPTESSSATWDRAVDEIARRLPTGRRDEIGVLARALDRMVREVRDGHLNLLALNRELEQRVRERTSELSEANAKLEASFSQLQQTNEQLQWSHEAQKRLVFSISHDLKTPLTTVKGYCELLMQSELTDEQRNDLQTIYQARERLQRLIEDILDSQKIDLRELELDIKEFDVGELIQQVSRAMLPAVQRHGNELVVQCAEDIPPMFSDADKISRVLTNLLSNAAKFTREGTITLRAARRGRNGRDWLVLEVADTGVGIDVEKRSLIFQPFPKIMSKAENPEGTGLGLSNCKGYCEAMGGDIDFTSEPGRGTTFTAWLPLRMEVLREDSGAARARGAATDERAERLGPAANARTVLVVDDEADIRELLKRFLQRFGFRVLAAASGEQALEMARAHRPALITLDAVMPGCDGWEVLERLKSDDATAGIPVIMVSVLDDKNRGFTLGAADYVTKPINWDRLTQTLRKYRGDARQGVVLVVDNDAALRSMTARRLEAQGWTVIEAENGLAALDRLQRSAPDVVLLDLLMPEMDGFAFLEALRQRDDARRHIPVVVFTSKDLTRQERARLNGRVIQVIEKNNIRWDELEAEINRLVTRIVQDS